jgi:hypothetical protein
MLAMFMPLAVVSGTARSHAIAARPAVTVNRAAVRMYWHIFPRDGMDSTYSDPGRSSTFRTALKNEYNVEPGHTQALGCHDMTYRIPGVDVDPEQCIVQVADDGSCVYAYAQGTQPTGWRTRPDEPWNWMQPGESVVLENGHKISLDYTNPENAVYKFEKAGRFLELPPGWVVNVDEASGDQYYYNDQTGQSQWDRPQY